MSSYRFLEREVGVKKSGLPGRFFLTVLLFYIQDYIQSTSTEICNSCEVVDAAIILSTIAQSR
jgi:hypothetical protein